MADDLGDIASLLGSSFVQTARMNEEEQNANRKDAMRQQLLYAFAAPLAQQAGAGLVGFAGDLLLGNKSKEFFERREGASFQTRLGNLKKPLEQLEEQRTLLMKQGKGASLEESILNFNRQKDLDNLENEYGHVPNYKAIMGEAIYNPSDKARSNARTQAEQLEEAIRNLKYADSLSDKELDRRYKLTDIGKGKARRFFKRLATGITGGNYDEDVVDPAVDFMITGGDTSLRDTDFYRLLRDKDGDFNKQLEQLVKEASDVTGLPAAQNLNNAFLRFEAENPEIAELLREDKKLARENAIEEATIRQSKDPDRDLIIQQLREENIPINKQTYGRQKLSNAKGITEPNKLSEQFTGRRRNLDSFNFIRDQITKGSTRFDSFDQVESNTERNKINDSARKYIAGAYTKFNYDYLEVIEELKAEGNYDLASKHLSKAGARALADKYVSMMLNPNNNFLSTEIRELPTKDLFQETLNFISGEPENIMDGTINDSEGKLKAFIKENLTNRESIKQNQMDALEDGHTRNVSREEEESGISFDPGINFDAVESDLNEIRTNLRLSETERLRLIANQINDLERNFRERFEKSGQGSYKSSIDDRINSLRNKYLMKFKDDTKTSIYLRGRN